MPGRPPKNRKKDPSEVKSGKSHRKSVLKLDADDAKIHVTPPGHAL